MAPLKNAGLAQYLLQPRRYYFEMQFETEFSGLRNSSFVIIFKNQSSTKKYENDLSMPSIFLCMINADFDYNLHILR